MNWLKRAWISIDNRIGRWYFRSVMTPNEQRQMVQKVLDKQLGEQTFKPKAGGFVTMGRKEDISRLKSRDQILEEFKKEKGLTNPEMLPMNEFLEFRKELFDRYAKAGV